MKITPAQRRALRDLSHGGQPLSSHKGTLDALAKKGLARYFPKTRRWQITRRGQEEFNGILTLQLGSNGGRNEGNDPRGDSGETDAAKGALYNRFAGPRDH